jgi:hypothetical protein
VVLYQLSYNRLSGAFQASTTGFTRHTDR